MRVVVAVKSMGGGGASRIARYIAEDGIIPEREGKRRPLFSEKSNDPAGEDRTYRAANQYLSRDRGTPRKKDLSHLVISLHNEDFEDLGTNDAERKEALREAAREAMEEMRADLKVGDWRWIAGIHLNTENPHLHIAIHKEVTDRSTARSRRLGNIPKRMLPHSERGSDGVIRSIGGSLGEYFTAALDRAQARAREADSAREEVVMVPLHNEERSATEQIELAPSIATKVKRLAPEEIKEKRLEIAIRAEKIRMRNPLPIDSMLEAASRNPSPGGRDLTLEIVERGLRQEQSEQLNPLQDTRAAFRNRSIDDSEYRTQIEQAGWLGEHSQELRDLYERGAVIRGDTLIIPAEEHEVPGERDHLRVIQISHAHEKIREDTKTAAEFHFLARIIAGETADTETEIKIFQYYHDRIERDADGHRLDRHSKDYEQRRAETLERVLDEMRLLAREMASRETRESIDAIPSITEPSHVYKYIGDFERAAEFYSLAQEIAGRDADPRREAHLFSYYYWKLERDDEGHKLAHGDDAGRFAAIDRTLAEMRQAIELREAPDTRELAEIPNNVIAFDEAARRRDNRFASSALSDEEWQALTEEAFDHEIDDARDLEEPEHDSTIEDAYNEREADAAAYQFNAASRKVNLRGERIPEGLSFETREWLIGQKLPEIDRRIERGDPLHDVRDERGVVEKRGIISDINRLIQPEREILLLRVSKAAGFSAGDAQIRPANREELLAAKQTLRELCDHEMREMERRRELRSRLEAAERGNPRADQPTAVDRSYLYNDYLAQRMLTAEVLLAELGDPQDALRNRQKSPSAANAGLYVSLSNDPNAPRLPVSNIRIYDAIEKMANEAKLPLSFRSGQDSPAFIHGLTQQEYDYRAKVTGFLKSYVNERLRDNETRLIHDRKIFRDAHRAFDKARTPEEFNRVAHDFISKNEQQDRLISEREREWLFNGRFPDHYTPETTDQRLTWGLPRDGRRQALHKGDIPSSPTFKAMLGDLNRRRDTESVSQFQAALINPPERMNNPSKLPLYQMNRRILNHEKDEIYIQAEKAKRELPRRVRPTRSDSKNPAQAAGRSPGAIPYWSKSYQEYIKTMGEINRQLIDEALHNRGDGQTLAREEQVHLRQRARNLAWGRLAPSEVFSSRPGDTALRLSDTIAKLQEEIQPRAALAAQVLDEFSRKNISSYKDGRMPKNALGKLEPHIRESYQQLRDYAQRTSEELYRGFEAIDGLRAEIEKARAEELMRDRKILGDVVVAQARYECAKFDHDLARDFGHTFRFRILDQSTKRTREISAFDVERRADARGVKAANEHLVQRAEDRRQVRQEVFSIDLNHHSGTLAEHLSIQQGLIDKREEEAGKAWDAYLEAREQAQSVINKYQEQGEPVPALFIDRRTLIETQEETIKRGLVVQTEALEQVRLKQAREFNRPLRTDAETARLRAQLFVARTDLKVREDRAEKFDRTRHLRQWEIGGGKLSLADVDRRLELAIDRTHILGNSDIHIFGRKRAGDEAERLRAVRGTVIGMIAEQRDELNDKVNETKKLVEILSQARERESDLRSQEKRALPEPRFTPDELERVANNAATLRSAALLKQCNEFQRRFNGYADPKERISLNEKLARSRGREVTAEVFLRESTARQADFRNTQEVHPLLVEMPDGRLITERFKDTQPQSFIELAARSLIETPADTALREAVQKALQDQKQHLQVDVERSRAYREATREITKALAAERNNGKGAQLPAPEFSSKELALIERFANRLPEGKERDRYMAFIEQDRNVAPARQTLDDLANHRREEAAPAPEPRSLEAGRGR
jgi:relaxase MobL-like protein